LSFNFSKMRCYVIFSLLLPLITAQKPASDRPNCKKLPGDPDWPTPDAWSKALPGVIPRGPQDPKVKRPDYQLIVTNVSQVQAAVKFAVDNNLRLSILNSAHDFVGRFVLQSMNTANDADNEARNDAPSGLSLMVGNLKGVRVAREFEPTPKGVKNVNYTSDPVAGVNVLKGKGPAVVTFGVGVTGQVSLHLSL
jgi:hypothetical protein